MLPAVHDVDNHEAESPPISTIQDDVNDEVDRAVEESDRVDNLGSRHEKSVVLLSTGRQPVFDDVGVDDEDEAAAECVHQTHGHRYLRHEH